MPWDTAVSEENALSRCPGIPLAEISRAVSTPFPILSRTRVGRLVPSDALREGPASAHDRHIARPDRLRTFPGASDRARASRPENRDECPMARWGWG